MSDEAIFSAALDHTDPADRAAFVARSCSSEAQRRRVEALLAAHARAGTFLDRPAVARPDPQHNATRTFGGDTPADENDADDLSFLQPSAKPGSLGRLGHYEMLQVLGRGGFGIVFRAFDDTLQRVVAVKVLAPRMAATSPARKRFLREARASAGIRHENVVQIHAIEEDPIPYLVMEFIPGETLQDFLDRNGPLDPEVVARVGAQVARGLAAAHDIGLIHRDIKPANVLLEKGVERRAKLTDFGLARAADDASITQSGVVAGTPMFMSPEQARGESLDHRSDLFGLGSVLYTMACGHPPFRAGNTLAVLKRVTEDTPRPVREVIPETPQWLAGVIEKLHAKDPDDRYQSAREVAEALSAGEKAAPAKVQPARRPRPAAKAGAGGNRWVWVAVAAAAFLLLFLPLAAVAAYLMLGWSVEKAPDHPRVVGSAEAFPPPPPPPVAPPAPAPGGKAAVAPAPAAAPPVASAPFDAARAKELQAAWARHLGLDVETTNSIGMRLTVVPPGRFEMGSPADGNDPAHEKPRHAVTLTDPFLIGTCEVTVGQFRQFVKATGYKTDAERGGGGSGRHFPPNVEFRHDAKATWRNPGFEQADDHPVVHVSWNDAAAFCAWLGEKEGRKYVLPTEARWEYAARAGTTSAFFWGDDPGQAHRFANLKDASLADHFPADPDPVTESNDRYAFTAPVGQFGANPFGLRDMTGNVWEWCDDWYDPDYYRASPPANPPGPASGDRRVLRGGSWLTPAWYGRSAFRDGGSRPHDRYDHIGFRVCVVGELKPKAPATPPPVAAAPFGEQKAKELQEAWAKHLGVPVEFTDSAGVKVRLVPPGEWEAAPGQRVRLTKAYYLGAHEVTAGQFRRFVADTKYKTVAEASGLGGWGSLGPVGSDHERKPEHVWTNRDFTPTDDHPVAFVTLADCQAFCEWLSRKEKRTCRLPTVAEWEWAGRGGSASDPYFGPAPDAARDHAWYDANSKNRSQPVGRKKANPFGLFDIQGNMWETCGDGPGGLTHRGTIEDPVNPAVEGRSAGRGGSFSLPLMTHTVNMVAENPTSDVGFRVLREVGPGE